MVHSELLWQHVMRWALHLIEHLLKVVAILGSSQIFHIIVLDDVLASDHGITKLLQFATFIHIDFLEFIGLNQRMEGQ